MGLSPMTLREAPTNANITSPPITSLVHNSCIEMAENEGMKMKEPQNKKGSRWRREYESFN